MQTSTPIHVAADSVAGTSPVASIPGVTGQNTAGGEGVVGMGATNGVHGQSASALNSGVWGENTGSGIGVAASSANGDGVYGTGAHNGVHGKTASATDSGVWGENTGTGYGVAGTCTHGVGVLGQGVVAGRFEGDVEVTGDVRLVNADCAEDFDVADAATIEPGTVLVLRDSGVLERCSSPYDRRVAGVVSGAGRFKPAIVLDRRESCDDRLPIALVGKVYCKVDAAYGAVRVGDLLTTSDTPGHAMKAADLTKALGAVLGKALAPLQTGAGLVPVLVALQ